MKELLTIEESTCIVSYILMTSTYRKEQLEGWERLSKETKPDGTPKYKNAAGNAEYMRNLENRLDAIIKKLEA